MGARVLLLNPNRSEEPYPVYPVGLAYLARTLIDAGHEIAFWDAIMSLESAEAMVARWHPDVIALSVRNIDNVQSHNAQWFVADLIETCKRVRAVAEVPLLMGGSGFSLFPAALLELTGATYGMIGEAEEEAVRLIEAIGRDETPVHLPGLVWREGDRIQVNPPPKCFAFEHRVPFHDHALLRAYSDRGGPIGLQTQRGCPLKCCYCTYPLIEGRNMRYRSPDSIVTELEELKGCGVPYAFFVDSVFNLSPKQTSAVCEELIRRDTGVSWGAFLRPHRITPELAGLLSRSGMKHAEFGSDSLNDTVLEAYQKSFTFADIEQAHNNLNATDVHCSHFIIAGGPGETAETLADTLAKSDQLKNAVYFAIAGMRVYPGTSLFDVHVASGGEPDPAKYLAPVFHLAPGLTLEWVMGRLHEHMARRKNWIVGDPPKAFKVATAKLRNRGASGPLWEYIDLLQRMIPDAGHP